MASSGSFNTSSYDVRYLTFNWSIASQDIGNNRTVLVVQRHHGIKQVTLKLL